MQKELEKEKLTEWMDKLIRLKEEEYEARDFSRQIGTCTVDKEHDDINLNRGIELIAAVLGEKIEAHRNGDYIHCSIQYKGWTFSQRRRISPEVQDDV